MKNIKIKLTLTMVTTTLILFLITFFLINYYQKKYIFDKAIISLERGAEEFKLNGDIYDEAENRERLFNVQMIFVEDDNDFFYLLREEKALQALYKEGGLVMDRTEKISNKYGEYYVLATHVSDSVFIGNGDQDIKSEVFPVIFYTDITLSTNIVNKVNIIFFIMLITVVIVEGVVGMYLGSKFEDSQSKLKHFFQNASHELKTPLMSIEGYAEGLRSGVIEDMDMASKIIIKKSNQMRLLVDEILNLSKLESKEYVLKKERVDLVDIIEESVDNFRVLSEHRGIEITIELHSQYIEVRADSLQLYKAVNTLIDNAFKHAKSTLTVKTRVDKKYAYVSIYNDGKHIDNEAAKHMFDRFYSTSQFSTGIGLAMAREILLLSKGDVAFKNTEDGVMFEIKMAM